MFLYSGQILNLNNTPPHMLWLQYISIFYYPFQLLNTNQWDGFGDIGCSSEDAISLYGCSFRNGDDVMRYFDVNPANVTQNYLILGAMVVLTKLIALTAIKLKSKV